MSYDRADWHYGGDFPSDLPDEAGSTHIGMFIAWAIMQDLAGPDLLDHSSDAMAQVRNRGNYSPPSPSAKAI